ncbi:MAG: hypothetical protein EoVTN8_416 [Fluviibacter phosphoraccumulans EoVTN8]
MLNYICSKLYSNIKCETYSKLSLPLLRVYGHVDSNSRSFYFDFTDSTTHLGDRLFFLPLLKALDQKKISIYLNSKDSTSIQLLNISHVNFNLIDNVLDSQICVVFPKPSFTSLSKNYRSAIIVDFTDFNSVTKISEQLILSFSKYFQLSLKNRIYSMSNRSLFDSDYFINEGSLGCYLFSNYIDSGRFRKFFVDENKLSARAIDLKKQGYRIIHVGSKQDRISDDNHYPFVDVDLRGETSVAALIQIVNSENVVGAITYDNFLMHLVGIHRKVAHVLFRGRFTRKNREHHMLYVNNTFFEDEEKLIYL